MKKQFIHIANHLRTLGKKIKNKDLINNVLG